MVLQWTDVSISGTSWVGVAVSQSVDDSPAPSSVYRSIEYEETNVFNRPLPFWASTLPIRTRSSQDVEPGSDNNAICISDVDTDTDSDSDIEIINITPSASIDSEHQENDNSHSNGAGNSSTSFLHVGEELQYSLPSTRERRRYSSPEVVVYSPSSSDGWRDAYGVHCHTPLSDNSASVFGPDSIETPRRTLFKQLPLEELHRLTRAKSRRWTHKNRIYLCVLKRVFDNDYDDLTLVFNTCFKTNVERRVLKSQYHSELRWYGLDRAWLYVMRQTSFQQMDTKWESVIDELAACAEICDVILIRRPHDMPNLLAKTSKPRSPGTIKRWRQLKKLSKIPIGLEDDEHEDEYKDNRDRDHYYDDDSLASLPTMTPPSSVGSPQLWQCLHLPMHVEQDSSPTSASSSITSTPLSPSILSTYTTEPPRFTFRSDYSGSGTIKDGRGLTAGQFRGWPNLVKEQWPSADDVCLQDQVIRHIWRHDSDRPYSTFVSTSTSLLELFRRALPNAATAVISVIEYVKVSAHTCHAGDLIRRLKYSGNLDGMRYRGTCEWLTYSHIPAEAIAHEFKFTDLQHRLTTVGSNILNRVAPNEYVSVVRKRMFDNPVPMDVRAAGILGIIASNFGVCAVSDADYVQLIIMLLIDALVIEFSSEPTSTEIDALVQHFISDLLRLPDGSFAPLGEDQFEILKQGFVLGLINGHRKLQGDRSRKQCSSSSRGSSR